MMFANKIFLMPNKLLLLLSISVLLNNNAFCNNNQDTLKLKISLTPLYNDFVQVYYSYKSPSFNKYQQSKVLVEKGIEQVIEFNLPFDKETIPFLRIDFGNKAGNSFIVKDISFTIDNHTYKLNPIQIKDHFNASDYLIIDKLSTEEISFHSIKIKNKCAPSIGLRFEKIPNIEYHMNLIDTVYTSQIELKSKINKNVITLVYFDDQNNDVASFKYVKTLKLREGINIIYSKDQIRHLNICFLGAEGDSIILKKVNFKSSLKEFSLVGENILKKFNIQGTKGTPIILKENISFAMSDKPTNIVLVEKITSVRENLFYSIKFISIFFFSTILLISINNHWLKYKTFIGA